MTRFRKHVRQQIRQLNLLKSVKWRWLRLLFVFSLSGWLSVAAPTWATLPSENHAPVSSEPTRVTQGADLETQAQRLYEAGEFAAAAQLFEQAAAMTAAPLQQGALLP
ncbi:MAG: hypothetical protein F6K42_20825 [Leptolyngbya sp. SIO1D8]|nr:hypothetical protein [Leptolyngbya sp. SIO1D8]